MPISLANAAHTAPHSRLEPLRFRHTPLLAAAACFILGILADRALPLWQLPALRACVTLLFISLAWITTRITSRTAPRTQIFAAGTAWIALGWTCAVLQQRPSTNAPIDRYADNLSRRAIATVTDYRILPSQHNEDIDTPEDYEALHAPHALAELDLALEQIEEITPDTSNMEPTSGGVRVIAPASLVSQLHCGDRIDLPLRLTSPHRFRDPGVWQYADFLAEQGIRLRATTHATSAAPLTYATSNFRCSIKALQRWAAQQIPRTAAITATHLPHALALSPQDASTLNAMLLGDRTGLHPQLRLHFERTGSFHILVVAGLHVALFAALCIFVLQAIGIHRLSATLIALPLVTAYAVLTGFGPPTQRALAMTIVYLLARAFARDTSALNALGAAALAILILKPSLLYEASLQMTLLAVIAIAGIALPIAHRTFGPYLYATRRIRLIALDSQISPLQAQFRVHIRLIAEIIAPRHARRFAQLIAFVLRVLLASLELILFSVISEVLMSLPMMIYFHRLTPFALPANLLAITLIAPLMISAAVLFIASCLLSMFTAWVALVPTAITALLLHTVIHTIRFFSLARFSELRTPTPATWQTALFLAALALCFFTIRRQRWIAFVGAFGLIAAFTLLLLPRHVPASDALQLTAIDVGQGDSLLLQAPSGAAMLIDAGGPTGRAEDSPLVSSYDIGEEVVSPYLWQRGIARVDIVVLTHAHSDHMGGMAAIVRNFHPRQLWTSVEPRSEAFAQLLQTAKENGTSVVLMQSGNTAAWNGISFRVLAPQHSGPNNMPPTNNDSLVLQATWNKTSLLLEGDAEQQSEAEMLSASPPLTSTLLKIGHHGSRTSTTQPFLDAVHPSFALISDGRGNHFGHPRIEVLQRLQQQHVRTYRTDMLGAVTASFHADGSAEITQR